jgi:hypothetical protein
MGFSLSVLAAAIGVAQFLRQIIALQWIFAFVIMAILFIMTVIVAVPAWAGRGNGLELLLRTRNVRRCSRTNKAFPRPNTNENDTKSTISSPESPEHVVLSGQESLAPGQTDWGSNWRAI